MTSQHATSNGIESRAFVAGAVEILFVDSRVADFEVISKYLHPVVEAVALDPFRSVARQIASVLAGRCGLAAVHIIAHGAPGRVNFASGEWCTETLADGAEDFAAIGPR